MSFRLADSGWDGELAAAITADGSHVRIVCPFIKKKALDRLLKARRSNARQVITRFNLADFAKGVSDLGALRLLLDRGAEVRGVRNLHAKLYIFGSRRAIGTSANLTDAALFRNHEFGFVAEDAVVVERCRRYFDDLWSRAGPNLTSRRLADWEEKLARYLATGGKQDALTGLGDEGVDVGASADASTDTSWVAEAPQTYVKFLGEGDNRVQLSFSTLDEIDRAGCHWAVAYPAAKRPTGVEDGALIFIGRLTREPNDIRVFGRAIGMRHQPGRDDATAADIALRDWKKKWPRYIRVHHAEFVSGTMSNGVSLNKLMNALKAQAFAATQRNAAKGQGNTDPRKAYRQQAAVELSRQGTEWLSERLDVAFQRHGKVSPVQLAKLDWPVVPSSRTGTNR